MTGTLPLRAFGKEVAMVALLSVLGNSVLLVLGKMFYAPPATFGPYMWDSVLGLTVAGVLAAAVVYLLMRKYGKDSAVVNKRFVTLSIVVLVLSFYPDIALPWSTDADQVGWNYVVMGNLMLMHVVPAVLVIRRFTKRALA